jgi:polysaccharide deacetylase 2 family uncharacterized protein YibQ
MTVGVLALCAIMAVFLIFSVHFSLSRKNAERIYPARERVIIEFRPLEYEIISEEVLLPPPPPPPVFHIKKGGPAKVAIILDDAGGIYPDYAEIFSINSRFTISILPNLPDSSKVLRDALAHGKEAILHLPMEPENEMYVRRTGDMILTSMNDEEIRKIVIGDMNSLKGVIGVNNHMGSRATGDPRVMKVVLDAVKERRLFFVDSRTSSRSVAYGLAREEGIPSARNEIFLDVDGTDDGVRARFRQLVDMARRDKSGIGICHVTRKGTINVLRELMPEYEKEGIEFVGVSSVVK